MAALKGKAFLKDTEAWQKLQNYFDQNKDNINILDLFNKDPERFSKFSCKLDTPLEGPLLVDYSKNRINDEVMELLLNLGKNLNSETGSFKLFLSSRERSGAGEGGHVRRGEDQLHRGQGGPPRGPEEPEQRPNAGT